MPAPFGKFLMVFPLSSAFVIEAAVDTEPRAWTLTPDPAVFRATVGLVIMLFEIFRSEIVPLLLRMSTPNWYASLRTLFVTRTVPSTLLIVVPLSLKAMFESKGQ